MNDTSPATTTEWWLASLGKTLIWARLQVLESGVASVLDCDGGTLPFDSEDTARAALLDAEFRAYDGLDTEDAAQMGFSLEAVQPPSAETDAALREQMVQVRGKH